MSGPAPVGGIAFSVSVKSWSAPVTVSSSIAAKRGFVTSLSVEEHWTRRSVCLSVCPSVCYVYSVDGVWFNLSVCLSVSVSVCPFATYGWWVSGWLNWRVCLICHFISKCICLLFPWYSSSGSSSPARSPSPDHTPHSTPTPSRHPLPQSLKLLKTKTSGQ